MLIESADFNLLTCPHDMALCMLKLQPTKMTLALAAAFSVSAAQAADNAPEALNTRPPPRVRRMSLPTTWTGKCRTS
jgi:LPS-assembly protein